jgi:hypothetical protein
MTSNNLFITVTLCGAILLCPLVVRAQNQLTPQTRSDGATATVSFSFNSTTEGTSIRQGIGGDNRYYVRVPVENNPVTDPYPAVELRVERDASDRGFLVYSFPIQPGTSPQVDFERAALKILFTPPTSVLSANSSAKSNLAANVGRAETRSAIMRTGTATPVTPASQPATSPATTTPSPQTPAALTTSALKQESINTTNIDLAVPESPAFTVLGLTPQTVTRPATPRALATSLLNGVDQNGNFQSGLAFDVAPYLVLAGAQLQLRDYQTKYGLRLLTRLQTSFATTKGASENDKSIRLALGFHATLWDRGDPRLDDELLGCFARDLKVGPDDILEPIPIDDPGRNGTPEQKAAYSAYLEEKKAYDKANEAVGVENTRKAEKCRNDSKKKNWNRSSWIVAAAPSWLSPDGKTSNYEWNGGGVWSSLAYGFEGVPGLSSNSQLIFHVRYRDNEMVSDPDVPKTFFSQDSLYLGSRLRIGTANSTGSFEGVFVRSRKNDLAFENSSRFSLGLERKVAENMWFNISFGGERGRSDGRNNGFVLTAFRWGFSEKKMPTPAPQ